MTNQSPTKLTRCPQYLVKTFKKKPRNAELPDLLKTMNCSNNINVPIIEQEKKSFQMSSIGMKELASEKYLKIRTAVNLRINRARMIDWLLDVCRAFELRWESYWCSVELLDFMIFQINCVNIENIHVVGVTCLFMGTKIHETDPPSLSKIVEKAVYNTFSCEKVIEMEALILISSANAKVKPNFLRTVYNTIFDFYPNLTPKEKKETLRRLIIIWMDPKMVLNKQSSQKQEVKYSNENHISYINLVSDVVKLVSENKTMEGIERVEKYYKDTFQCENIQEGWGGFEKLRI